MRDETEMPTAPAGPLNADVVCYVARGYLTACGKQLRAPFDQRITRYKRLTTCPDCLKTIDVQDEEPADDDKVTGCGNRTCPDCYEQPETAAEAAQLNAEAKQQPRARAYRYDGRSIEDHPVDDREIRTIELPRAPFDHDDTIAALAILHKAVRDASPGPAAAWNIVSHAETRLNRELNEYYRGARA